MPATRRKADGRFLVHGDHGQFLGLVERIKPGLWRGRRTLGLEETHEVECRTKRDVVEALEEWDRELHS